MCFYPISSLLHPATFEQSINLKSPYTRQTKMTNEEGTQKLKITCSYPCKTSTRKPKSSNKIKGGASYLKNFTNPRHSTQAICCG
jgi:hypothetical protein